MAELVLKLTRTRKALIFVSAGFIYLGEACRWLAMKIFWLGMSSEKAALVAAIKGEVNGPTSAAAPFLLAQATPKEMQ